MGCFLYPRLLLVPGLLVVSVFGTSKLFSQSEDLHLRTTVVPLGDEDLSSPCVYDIVIPAPNARTRAVWVVFERGLDVQRFYDDVQVRAFATRNGLAMMMPHHCRAKSYEDIDVDPAKGIGRVLFTALDQFADQS